METTELLADLPEKFVGERIVVRSFRPGDGPALFAAIDESREHILPWLPWGPTHDSPESSELKIAEICRNFEERTDLTLAIWNADESRLLGGTGLHRFDLRLRSFEIGYWIRVTEEGKGYVSEAVRVLTDYLFQTLKANRVFIRCAVKNQRSGAIPKRLGFQLEGVLRNTGIDADGELHDIECYSLIPEDYERVRPTW